MQKYKQNKEPINEKSDLRGLGGGVGREDHCLPTATVKTQDTRQTGNPANFTDNLLQVGADSEAGFTSTMSISL